MAVSAMWLFLNLPLVGLQCLIMVFPDHTHLLFGGIQSWVGQNGFVTNVL